MINSKIKFRAIIVLFTLAAMSAASVYVFLNKASASGFSGKIFTTTFSGQNENHFSSKDAVYLSGGPVHEGAAGLPTGSYYFQVTGPSGNDLLSTEFMTEQRARGDVVFSERLLRLGREEPQLWQEIRQFFRRKEFATALLVSAHAKRVPAGDSATDRADTHPTDAGTALSS